MTMKEQGFTDEEIGGPFMEWLRRDCARDEKEWEKEVSNGKL
jgi:hypothetical protein